MERNMLFVPKEPKTAPTGHPEKKARTVRHNLDVIFFGDVFFFFGVGWGFVVVEDCSEGWGVEVVELAIFGGDDEGGDAEGGQAEGDWDHDVDDGHFYADSMGVLVDLVGVIFLPARVQRATTVSELRGMMMAAMRAEMSPAMARDATTVL